MPKTTNVPNIQDKMLNEVKKQNVVVTIYMTNGFRQEAKIIGFDNFIILAEIKGITQMFYKHAISTIVFPSNFKPTEK